MPKAADIADEATVVAIKDICSVEGIIWASRWDIQRYLAAFPPKVVNAKLASMVRRGTITGCADTHDCRGDFTVNGNVPMPGG